MTEDPKTPAPEPDAPSGDAPAAEVPPAAPPDGTALVESPEQAAARLETELSSLKDRHLRLAAEFENFRKRVARERLETWSRAQAEIVVRMVDALDDLARFVAVDPAATDAKSLHDGVSLVERKVWKELDAAGLTRIDAVDVPFDPTVHEAVSTVPATSAAEDHTVGAVLQRGYRLKDVLVRPARVAVRVWSGAPGAAGTA